MFIQRKNKQIDRTHSNSPEPKVFELPVWKRLEGVCSRTPALRQLKKYAQLKVESYVLFGGQN